MRYVPEEKLAVYASAARGLNELESDPDKRSKYSDFADIYAALDENELTEYQRRYPKETAIVRSFSERFIEKGRAAQLIDMMELKFGPEAVAAYMDELTKADADTLRLWSERFITAESPDDVFIH